MNKTAILITMALWLCSCWIANQALSQCNPPPILNPDLDRSGTCVGCAPDGWNEYNGTPDVGNTTNVYCESDWINTCGTSAPGSTNDKIGRFRNETSSCLDLEEEGISQIISGLNPGQTYYLCFWAVNTGRGCDNAGPPQSISLQASMGGISNSVEIPFTGNSWAIYSIPVTPNSSTTEVVFVMPGANSGLGRGVIIFDQVTLECNPPDGPCPSTLVGDPCDAGSGAGSGTYNANCECFALPCPPSQIGTPCDAGSGAGSGTYDGNCECIALPCPLTCEINDPVNETCANAADGSFTVSATTTDPTITNIQYSIDGGATWSSNNTFSGLSTGTYSVISRGVGTTDDCATCEITLGCVNQTLQFGDRDYNGTANASSTGGDDPQHLSGPIEIAGTAISGNSTNGNSTLINSTNPTVILVFDEVLPAGGTVTISLADNNGSGNVTISDGNQAGDIIFSGGTQDVLQRITFTITQPTNSLTIIRNAGGTWVDGAAYNFTAYGSLGYVCNECESTDPCEAVILPRMQIGGE